MANTVKEEKATDSRQVLTRSLTGIDTRAMPGEGGVMGRRAS